MLCPLALSPIVEIVTSLWFGLSTSEDIIKGMKFHGLSEDVLV